jgi:hypothetical protein
MSFNIGGENIDTKKANSTGGVTQADLDTKENVLTQNSQSNIISLAVTDEVVITNSETMLYFKDTNNRSRMIHLNRI